MKKRNKFLLFLSVFILFLCVMFLWWINLSNIDRWLFVNRSIVESYIANTLNSDFSQINGGYEMPVELLDATISIGSESVMISLHDNHSEILVLFLNENSKNDFLKKYPNDPLKKISGNWHKIALE
jgi:hypothetical protein